MINASDIENFTKDCAKMFCRFNFPRDIRVITEKKFMEINKDKGIDYSKCLAYTSPGSVITVIYDRIERINGGDRGFFNSANSLAFTICHELSHLEQDLNPVLYNSHEDFRIGLELGNDLNTATVIMENLDLYSYLLQKYFESDVDVDTIKDIIESTEIYLLFKCRHATVKSIIERDIVLCFLNEDDVINIVEEMRNLREYTIILNHKDMTKVINVSSYNNSQSDFEVFEDFMRIINNPNSIISKRVKIHKMIKNNYLTISFTIL